MTNLIIKLSQDDVNLINGGYEEMLQLQKMQLFKLESMQTVLQKYVPPYSSTNLSAIKDIILPLYRCELGRYVLMVNP